MSKPQTPPQHVRSEGFLYSWMEGKEGCSRALLGLDANYRKRNVNMTTILHREYSFLPSWKASVVHELLLMYTCQLPGINAVFQPIFRYNTPYYQKILDKNMRNHCCTPKSPLPLLSTAHYCVPFVSIMPHSPVAQHSKSTGKQ